MDKKLNVLLVEPNFPYPNKSKNRANKIHRNFVPIGLLKLGAYYKSKGYKVRLVRGNKSKKELSYYKPNIVLITSLFTYWSKYLWDSVEHYRKLFPHSKIIIGGIYVTLLHNSPGFKRLASIYKTRYHVGLHKNAEKFLPDYSLLEGSVDYHVMHAMRGCIRKCKFCGVWRLEPKLIYKTPEIVSEGIIKIGKNKVIFYDNNFLANPHIENILKKLSDLRVNGRPVIFESQSGFDGRLLENFPNLAYLIRQARFRNIRIAWDNNLDDAASIKKQLNLLISAGYPTKEISVFILYNFDTPYRDILKKIQHCGKWGVQITDCRYRPLDSTSDNYIPGILKTRERASEYYIHTRAGWTDPKIRNVRRIVRQTNIGIRYGSKYDSKMEKWSRIHNTYKFFNLGRPPKMQKIENTKSLQERIKIMDKVKNECRKRRLNPPNLKNLSNRLIDKNISNFIKEKGII